MTRDWSAGGAAWLALAVAALVLGGAILAILRAAADPRAVARARGRITARLLEIVLYRHDPVVGIGALGRLLAAQWAHARLLLVPLAIGVAVMLLAFGPLSTWFACRPLRVGEAATVTAVLAPGFSVLDAPVDLQAGEALRVETPPLRVAGERAVLWRVRATDASGGWLAIRTGPTEARVPVRVGDGLKPVVAVFVRSGVWNRLRNPYGARLPARGPVESVRVGYPAREFALGGVRLHWLVALFLVTAAWLGVLRATARRVGRLRRRRPRAAAVVPP